LALLWGVLAIICGLLAVFFNVTNAISLWGALGGYLAIFGFPIMFVVVPIALIMRGEIPIYLVLLVGMGVFYGLAERSKNE